ncbi:hypothetical protein RSAG8_10806, partial [Rhizoctonia solani AG-8 WAC10335]
MTSHLKDAPLLARDFSEVILSKLSLEAILPVPLAITRFAHAPTPPKSRFVWLSFSPPTILQSASTIDTCYNLWLALPVPDSQQLSQLRQDLSSTTADTIATVSPLSLELVYASHTIRLPLWPLNLWPTLQSLIKYSQSWDSARKRLFELVATNTYREQATRLLDQLTELHMNAEIPGLPSFRTAYIPDLIRDSWLSDNHINAGVDLINSHFHRRTTTYALDSFFLLNLEQSFERSSFERSSLWCPRRPALLDGLVVSQGAVELLIPVHRPGHWTLLHVNIDARCYSYCDTLNPANYQAPQSLIDHLNQWLTGLLGMPIVLVSSPRPFPLDKQLDGHSCGVAVLSTMANIALDGVSKSWSQLLALEHRLNWSFYLLDPVLGSEVGFV